MALIDICRCHINRLLTLLISLLICLQLLNVWLTEHQSIPYRNAGSPTAKSITNEMILKSFWSKYHSFYVIDSRGEFRIIRNLVSEKLLSSMISRTASTQYYPDSQLYSPTNPHYYPGVTLVTHCTSNHLYRLLELSRSWQGPISVAVFVDEDVLTTALNTIAAIFTCHLTSLQNVSLHLVLPLTIISRYSQTPAEHSTSCDDLERILEMESNFSENYAASQRPYPNNLLRNVAIESSRTEFIFTIDIDMIPSPELWRQLFQVIQSNDTENTRHIAYVVPAFEITQSVRIPTNKHDLITLWEKNLIRPFYEEMCSKCQFPTDYFRWRSITRPPGLSVAYEAEWRDPWEPFYIISIQAPRYSDMFKQYGFNRISQSCELHVAGYKFLVLDNAFLIHRGFKTSTGFHQSKVSEQKQNRALFRRFKSDLKLRYPNSTLRC